MHSKKKIYDKLETNLGGVQCSLEHCFIVHGLREATFLQIMHTVLTSTSELLTVPEKQCTLQTVKKPPGSICSFPHSNAILCMFPSPVTSPQAWVSFHHSPLYSTLIVLLWWLLSVGSLVINALLLHLNAPCSFECCSQAGCV